MTDITNQERSVYIARLESDSAASKEKIAAQERKQREFEAGHKKLFNDIVAITNRPLLDLIDDIAWGIQMTDLTKYKTWRSDKYLEWIKTQPSCISGIEPAGDSHHVKGHGMGGSVKAPDYMAIPLTRGEHNNFHSMGWKSWEELHGNQLEHVARTLGMAIENGVFHL